MPPRPPRKPAPPAAPVRAAAPAAKAAPPKKPESFIGNDSSTMMSDETFEEFEVRMKSSEGDSGGTNTNPALEEREEEDSELTFDKYVEVLTAQSCWAQQGKDADEMLEEVFNLNAVEWSKAAASWGQKMKTDLVLKRDQFPVLSAKYTQKYMAEVEEPDGDE